MERVPRAPVAPAHGSFALADTTGRSQQQRPRGVGGRVGQHLRRVPDGNAAPRGVGNIDIVESYGQLADDLELRPNRVHEFAVDLVGKEAEDAVHAPRLFEKDLRGRGKLVRPHFGVHLGPDHLKGVGEDFAGDERARSRHLQRLSRKTSEIQRGPFYQKGRRRFIDRKLSAYSPRGGSHLNEHLHPLRILHLGRKTVRRVLDVGVSSLQSSAGSHRDNIQEGALAL